MLTTRSLPTVICLLIVISVSHGAGANDAEIFHVDDATRAVIVRTSRYQARLVDGLFVSLRNRLVDEEMCAAENRAAPEIARRACGSGIIVDLKGAKRRWIAPGATYTTTRISPHAMDVTYAGLAGDGDGEQQDSLTFHLAVEPLTEDLLVRLSCKTRTPGISDLAFCLPSLQRTTKCIVPQFWGNVLCYEDFAGTACELRWPSHSTGLRFQMAILEGARGTCMVWSEDYDTMQPKRLSWDCFGTTPGLAMITESLRVPVETQTATDTVTWRLNVFGPDWREAADRYKAHLARTYHLEEMKTNRPRLAKELQVFARLPQDDQWLDALRTSGLALERCVFVQWGWRWFTEQNWRGAKHWKSDYPASRFRVAARGGQPDLRERIDKLHQIGGNALVFTPHNNVGTKHRLWSLPEHDREAIDGPVRLHLHLGSPEVRRYLIPQLEDLFAHLPADGIYVDTAGTTRRFWGPQEESLYEGMTYDKGTEVYFRELRASPVLNSKVIFGETVNELDFAGIDMAILGCYPWGEEDDKARRLKRVHPLCAYLLSDSVKLVTHGSAWPNQYRKFHYENDYGETIGQLPVVYAARGEDIADPRHEHRLALRKAGLFSTQNLVRFFPKTLAPDVSAYYHGADGAEYRFVRDRGSAMVRVADGESETLFRRIHGTTQFAGTGHIDDWVCYHSGTAIGLDPERYYCYFNGAPENTVTVSELPDGWCVSEMRESDRYLVVRFHGLPEYANKGRISLLPKSPLLAVCLGGELVHGPVSAGQTITIETGEPTELVLLRSLAAQPAPRLAWAPPDCSVQTVMANGFAMRPSTRAEDPSWVRHDLDGRELHGVEIRIAPSSILHQSAKTYIDTWNVPQGRNLAVRLLPRTPRPSRDQSNRLLVSLDGGRVVDLDVPATGLERTVIHLETANGRSRHLVSICYAGAPMTVYPEWE